MGVSTDSPRTWPRSTSSWRRPSPTSPTIGRRAAATTRCSSSSSTEVGRRAPLLRPLRPGRQEGRRPLRQTDRSQLREGGRGPCWAPSPYGLRLARAPRLRDPTVQTPDLSGVDGEQKHHPAGRASFAVRPAVTHMSQLASGSPRPDPRSTRIMSAMPPPAANPGKEAEQRGRSPRRALPRAKAQPKTRRGGRPKALQEHVSRRARSRPPSCLMSPANPPRTNSPVSFDQPSARKIRPVRMRTMAAVRKPFESSSRPEIRGRCRHLEDGESRRRGRPGGRAADRIEALRAGPGFASVHPRVRNRDQKSGD